MGRPSGAGVRGVLHLPVDGDRVGMTGVGGEYLDLLTHRDRVFALAR